MYSRDTFSQVERVAVRQHLWRTVRVVSTVEAITLRFVFQTLER